MKRRYTNPFVVICALTALGLATYPIYAGSKDDGKLNVQSAPQPCCSKAVIAPAPAGRAYVRAAAPDPFSEFLQMRQEMLNLMNSSFNSYQDSPGWEESLASVTLAPACDIRQTADKYIITMDLPGMRKSDIKITLNGSLLSITGRRESKIEKKEDGKMLLQERTVGSFSRTFKLPGKVKQDKIEAEYENGTLTLEIPLEKPADNSVDIPIK